ncbi:putative pyoverdine biosynthesis [Rosellinia necatrix]|uniref:Putative pyoverdine biosynthesis n=1 Tax=Rosellinia necatrix TaxID=77044 RepID=A0A1W2TS46_ROSNE|nr:putative pyoverdine biosynthesis [Rosellinia necatrix]
MTSSNGMKPSPVASAADLGSLEASHLEISSRILAILSRYRLPRSTSSKTSLEGVFRILSQIYSQILTRAPIRLCLPAFPFKSPNSAEKVLGCLPDKAEEIALAHLNGMCAAIADIYPPGASLVIISDGLVYNDLLSVPDKQVWAYGEALRRLALDKGFSHIEFCRLGHLVDINLPKDLDEITYVANATNFRFALLTQHANPKFDASAKIRENEDVCQTYRGYIKFLATDLRTVYPLSDGRTKSKYKQGIEYIAKQMLARGDAFASAVRNRFHDHIRLSIHPSTGETKFPISLLPTDTSFTTPWHCTLAVRLSGETTTGQRADFEADPNYELVYENGRPSYFREKSDLFSWTGAEVSCSPLYPAGWIVEPAVGAGTLTMGDVDAKKVRQLAERASPVILRNFTGTTDRENFIKKASDFGTPVGWKFGLLLEVKDRGVDTRGLNNVLSDEWMPFHYDGLFKTKKHIREDGTEENESLPPRFQLFTAVTPSPKDTGYTLFTSSTILFKHLPKQLPVEYLSKLRWSVSTSSFDATTIRGLPLVVSHPQTEVPCLRYHEPWPQSKTRFDPTIVEIDNPNDGWTSESICDELDSLLHDRRITYYHTWEKGDMLVSDNILAMHTRSDFTGGSDRELWRIHFD